VPTYFEYAGGAYCFIFNKDVIAGTMTMSEHGSDLPANLQPGNLEIRKEITLPFKTFPDYKKN
jgi:hypothetical protein